MDSVEIIKKTKFEKLNTIIDIQRSLNLYTYFFWDVFIVEI